jgi:hypothetical protein
MNRVGLVDRPACGRLFVALPGQRIGAAPERARPATVQSALDGTVAITTSAAPGNLMRCQGQDLLPM